MMVAIMSAGTGELAGQDGKRKIFKNPNFRQLQDFWSYPIEIQEYSCGGIIVNKRLDSKLGGANIFSLAIYARKKKLANLHGSAQRLRISNRVARLLWQKSGSF